MSRQIAASSHAESIGKEFEMDALGDSSFSHEVDGDDSEDDSSVNGSIGSESSNSDLSEGYTSKKKKKKKKKKKNKDGQAPPVAAMALNEDKEGSLPQEEADARLNAAVESLRSKDELCLWVQLANCRLTDKRTKRLVEAMKDNGTVISIDLSHNLITDQGISHLALALTAGAAPDLIQLNLRGNSLSEKSVSTLTDLLRIRKYIKIDILEEREEKEASRKVGSWNDEYEGVPPNSWLANADVNGWGDVGGSSAKERPRKWLPKETVEIAVRAILDSHGQLNVREVSDRVSDVATMVVRELQEEQHKTYAATSIESLPLGIRLTCQNLRHFVSVLHLSPAPMATPGGTVEAVAGRHRIAVIDLLHRLLMSCNRVVEQQVAACNALQLAVNLMFHCDRCSKLHVAVARLVQVVWVRPITVVATQLLDGEQGLISRLAREGSACSDVPIGDRKGNAGFVILLSQQLLALSENHRAIQKKFVASEEWLTYASKGGPLDQLLAEQEGALGGSKPDPHPPSAMAGDEESRQFEEVNIVEVLQKLYFSRAIGGFKAVK